MLKLTFLRPQYPPPADSLVHLMIFKAAVVRGILIGSVAQYVFLPFSFSLSISHVPRRFKDLLRLFTTHQVKPVVDKVFAFEEAAEAFKYLSSQKHVGNVVVRVVGQ